MSGSRDSRRTKSARKAGESEGPLRHRGMPGICSQVCVLIRRFTLKKFRAASVFLFDVSMHTVGAIVIGILVGTEFKVNTQLLLHTMMMVVAFGILAAVGSIKTFSSDKLTFWREAGSGMSVLAYFLSRNVVDLVPILVVRPGVYSLVVYDMVQPNIDRTIFIIIFMGVSWCQSGLGYVMAALVDERNVQLSTVLVSFLLGCFFSGVLPQLDDIYQNGGPQLFIANLSYGRWAMEAIMVTWMNNIPGVFQGYKLLDHVG